MNTGILITRTEFEAWGIMSSGCEWFAARFPETAETGVDYQDALDALAEDDLPDAARRLICEAGPAPRTTMRLESVEGRKHLFVAGNLEVAGSVVLEGMLFVGWNVKVGGSIRTGGDISIGWTALVGKDVCASMSILAANSLRAGRNIQAGTNIDVGGDLEAGGYIITSCHGSVIPQIKVGGRIYAKAFSPEAKNVAFNQVDTFAQSPEVTAMTKPPAKAPIGWKLRMFFILIFPPNRWSCRNAWECAEALWEIARDDWVEGDAGYLSPREVLEIDQQHWEE